MPRKQRASWGSVQRVERNKYRLRYWADLHDGRGYARRSKTVRGTRREAEDELARLRVDHSAEAPVPTVGQCYKLYWLPDAEARVEAWRRDPTPGKRGEKLKEHSFQQYMTAWRRRVGPAWRDVPVTDVKPSGIQEWLDGMRGQPALIALSVLKSILNFAAIHEHIDRNPATAARYRVKDGSHASAKPWTLEELVGGVWPAVWGTHIEAAVILAAFGSCHIGEALGPRLEDVSFDRSHGMTVAVVWIGRQIDANGRACADGDLKNKWRARYLAIPEPWSLRLEELAESKREAGDVWLTDNGLGEPISQDIARRMFRKALEAKEMDPREFRLLRVSWRSWMASSGVPSELLEKMMGHVGDGVTGRHYLRPSADQFVEAVAEAFARKPVEVPWDYLDGQK